MARWNNPFGSIVALSRAPLVLSAANLSRLTRAAGCGSIRKNRHMTLSQKAEALFDGQMPRAGLS